MPRMNMESDPRSELIETGRDFHRRGWSLATSSNYSVVVCRDPLRIVLTGSGFDKGRLTRDQFVEVDREGSVVDASGLRPSAETWLHVVLARSGGAGAVLHTHSVWGTLLSRAAESAGSIEIGGFEMLKALSGVVTHQHVERIRVFPNTQDIASLAAEVEACLRHPDQPLRHGFLIAGHGLYAWGRDLPEARRHVEAIEFLLELVGLGVMARTGGGPAFGQGSACDPVQT